MRFNMRFFILLVLCLGVNGTVDNGKVTAIKAGLTETLGNKKIKEVIEEIDENERSSTRRRVANFGEKYGIVLEDNEADVTDPSNFVYPCELDDLDCIRDFLADNSDCKRVKGPVPDPLYLLQSTIYYTSINLTLTVSDAEFSGLSEAEIRKFYLNEKTGNLVLAFQIPVLTVRVPKAYIGFRRPGEETIIRSDSSIAIYRCLYITTIIPNYPKFRLNLAEVHAYLPDATIEFEAGPNLFDSTDPTVVAAEAAFLPNINLLYKENFVTQSQLFAALYIQSLLCDFDVDLYSV